MKEEIFSRFINYNQKLEEILEEKDFSEKVKNLLLSMLYKIETAYKDYETVKVNVPNKSEFIENILEIIKDCKKIEIIKRTSEEGIKFEKNKIHFKVDRLKNIIKTYENEKDMLEAIIDLNVIQIYLPEEYNLIRVAFAEMLNEGSKNSDVEIIRDFNAWSWNILKGEISNIYYNIIYQNLLMLFGYEVIEEIVNKDDTEDIIKIFREELEKIHNKQKVDEFLNLIYKISIDACIIKNELEKNRLFDEKKFLLKEYEEINNKQEYLTKITEIKKNNNIEIRKIDTILSSKESLLKEYVKRNEKLPKYNQLYSVVHLKEILNKQRRKLLSEIENCNQKLDPQNYIKNKTELKEQLDLLANVEQESFNFKIIEENIIKLQEVFINFFEQKIIQAEEKEDLLKLVYLLRYYKFIPLARGYVKDAKSLLQLIEKLEEKLLLKLWEQKAINKSILEDKINIKILKNIFDTKIINILNIQIKLIKNKDKIDLELYDAEVLEKTIQTDIEQNEIINIKLNKKIKIFN